MMETKLARISQLSKQNPNMVFTSIGHLINEEMLKECHRDMDGDKAVGIDGITKEKYEANLEENVTALVKNIMCQVLLNFYKQKNTYLQNK